MSGEIDFTDVQGLVRFGYRRMTEASYALLRIKAPDAARAWLRAAPIADAAEKTPAPATSMQVAFTASGLEVLGIPPAVLAGFSAEFLGGMAETDRARRLGDVGANAPAQWEWGGAAREPHVLVMFFAEPGGLRALLDETAGPEWSKAFELLRCLDTTDIGPIEPFGFADGISQPSIDWQQQRDPLAPQVDYSNEVALGEFLLGYRNEYGKYTERPLLDADARSAHLLEAADAPEKKDLGRNGTYLVMRQLRQDVRGFWQYLVREGGDLAAAEMLGAALVGRTRAGDPLVPTQDRSAAGAGLRPDQSCRNRFTFDHDPDGLACPFGAHIRRANPRNADFVDHPSAAGRLLASLGLRPKIYRDDLTSSVRYHRVLRRGREYGPWLPPAEALAPAPDGDPERGIHFICLNANIARQFEFLQSAWMVNTKFAGLTGESDPLVGTREPIAGCPATAGFAIPQPNGVARRLTGLPQFVTVRGGAYFFLPSLRAIRYLAG